MADRIDISAVARVVDQASRPLRGVTTQIASAGKAAKTTGSAFARLNVFKFGGLTAGIRGVSNSLGGLGKAARSMIAPLTAMVGAFTVGKAISSMKSWIETTDKMGKTARRLGITAEDLQKFRYVAQQSGVDTGTLEGAMSRFQKTLGNVAKGGKGAAVATQVLKRMGVTMEEIKAGDLAAILPKVAAGFEKNVNPIQRAAVAEALMGKQGKELINMFAAGKISMEELMAEAVKLGLISNKTTKEAEDAADAWGKFETSLGGVRNAIYSALLPAVKPALDEMSKFVTANKDVISKEVKVFFTELSRVLKTIDWKAVWEGAKAVGRALDWMATKIGGWEYLILAFILILKRNLVIALAQAAWGILAWGAKLLGLPTALAAATKAVKAFSLALWASPITWIIGLVLLLALAVYLIIKHWEPIKKFFAELWADPKKKFWEVLDWLGDFIGQFIPEPIKAAWTAFKTWWGETWTEVKPVLDKALEDFGTFVDDYTPDEVKHAWEATSGFLEEFWDIASEDFWAALDWLGDFVAQFIPEPIKNAWNAVSGFFAELWNDPKKKFWEAVDWLGEFVGQFIPEPIKKAWNVLSTEFGNIWKTVIGWFEWGRDQINKVVDKILEFIGPLLAPLKAVAGGIGKVVGGAASLAGSAWDYVTGGGTPAAAPSAVAPQSLIQQNQQANAPVPAKVEGQVEANIKIETTGDIRATATARDRGQVHSNVDVGRSMAAAPA
jgi:hypothetical protein